MDPTLTADDLVYLEQNVIPFYLLFSSIFSIFTIISYPVLLYAIWRKNLKMSLIFRSLSTYTHASGFIFSVVFLIFQPVGIPQLHIIYSKSLLLNFNADFTFAFVCIFVTCATHSCHGLSLTVLYCYHMSLSKCQAWFSDRKKLTIIFCVWYFIVFTICVGHCFTLPNSAETLRKLADENKVIAEFALKNPSIIAFSLLNNQHLKIFLLYTVIIITIFICFCLFLFRDYLKYRSEQDQQLSNELLKTIHDLRLNYRIRVFLVIFFLILPSILFIFLLLTEISAEATFICVALLAAYPFLDIIVEILCIKVYRKNLFSLFTFKKRLFIFRKHSAIVSAAKVGTKRRGTT